MQVVERMQKLAAARPGVIALAGGLPASDLLPADGLAAAFARAVRAPEIALQYGWCEGLPELRRWVAARLTARGASVGEDDVVITAGAQQALSLASAEILGEGQRVHVGAASYPAALELFRLRGAHPVADGRSADALYLMPGVANPTATCGVPDPEAVLADGRPLLVDEAYAELRFDGRVSPLLLAGGRDRVWHVGTVSKTLCPGLRVGWLVPPPDRRDAVLARKQATDLQAGSLAQAVLARFLVDVDYDAHVATIREAYARRARRMVDALARHAPSWRFHAPEGGFSIFVETGVRGDDTALLASAIDAGVSFDPGHLFRTVADDRVAFRLSFSYASEDELDEGVARLARVWRATASTRTARSRRSAAARATARPAPAAARSAPARRYRTR